MQLSPNDRKYIQNYAKMIMAFCKEQETCENCPFNNIDTCKVGNPEQKWNIK